MESDHQQNPTPKAASPEASRPLRGRGLRFVPGGFSKKSGIWRLRGRVSATDYSKFLTENPSALLFCLLWIFASGFGQTFVLSIFQPYWLEALNLTTGSIGLLYGGATLLSGLLLRRMGAWVDDTPDERVALSTALGLALGALIVALSVHWTMLFAAIFALRFFGQGASSMLGTTSAVRRFPKAQGKAVSVAGLGYPAGEALLPWLFAGSIAWLGWRGSAGLIAAGVLLLILPLSSWLRARADAAQLPDEASDRSGHGRSKKSRTDSLFRDPRFLLMLIVMTPLPFIGTGVIFFQTVIGSAYGWPDHTFATGFFLFALTRAGCSLFAGAWADRIGPVRIFGLSELILALGLICLTHPQTIAAYAYFIALGLSFGISSAVITPTLSHVFGLEHIGEVRGASASVAVFSTALAPILFGYAYEFGMAPRTLLILCAAFQLLIAWPVSLWIRIRLLRNPSPGDAAQAS